MNRFTHSWKQLGRVLALSIMVLAAACLVALPAARAQTVQSWIITIDASTTLPVATGFTPPNTAGDVMFFAEGTLRTTINADRFDQGWFGPTGKTNSSSTSQPIADGMPYGALIGGFNPNVPSYQYLGRMGGFPLQPVDVGEEFHLGLNLSGADAASLEGELTVTIIYIPEGSADVAQVVLNHSAPQLVGTGLIAQTDDEFIVLPYGWLRDPSLANSAYTDGYFGPAGLTGVVGTTPLAKGPYGGLCGTFTTAPGAFSIGDGGAWDTEPADVGLELKLMINVDAVVLPGLNGKFVVNVVHIPYQSPAGVDHPGPAGSSAVSCFPNPTREATHLSFRLDREAQVRLRIYDSAGRWVRNLLDEPRPAGLQSASWNGRDDAGRRLPAGTYFYQLSRESGSETGRVVLVD